MSIRLCMPCHRNWSQVDRLSQPVDCVLGWLWALVFTALSAPELGKHPPPRLSFSRKPAPHWPLRSQAALSPTRHVRSPSLSGRLSPGFRFPSSSFDSGQGWNWGLLVRWWDPVKHFHGLEKQMGQRGPTSPFRYSWSSSLDMF